MVGIIWPQWYLQTRQQQLHFVFLFQLHRLSPTVSSSRSSFVFSLKQCDFTHTHTHQSSADTGRSQTKSQLPLFLSFYDLNIITRRQKRKWNKATEQKFKAMILDHMEVKNVMIKMDNCLTIYWLIVQYNHTGCLLKGHTDVSRGRNRQHHIKDVFFLSLLKSTSNTINHLLTNIPSAKCSDFFFQTFV